MDETTNSVLIVDDETPNHIFLTQLLSPEYTVFSTKDGRNAIQKAMDISPDIILLDIMMPGISGYEVLSELKNIDETRDIPVIFITALNTSEDEQKGLALEAVDYISKPFSADVVKLRVRNQIKIVNQMREINRLSMTDQLTGIANRRGFNLLFNREWNRSIRDKSPIGVLLLDVDKFKVYNDTYGHQQGDAVLKEIAKTTTETLERATDFAARWGGEEFIVLLPNTNPDGALKVAEKIRANIERLKIPLPNGETTRVTASIGVNSVIPSRQDCVNEHIEKADKALYLAKQTGRNRVCN
jgi:diguanylate cyclase (GGDEF)-like protein